MFGIYNFDTKLKQGERFEAELDTFFSSDYDIQPATRDQQRAGIDRVFTRRDSGNVCRVEYKSDLTASRTGNAFVETVSVDAKNKPGWAYTSQADYLMYYLPKDRLIYIIAFDALRKRLPAWGRYPSRPIPNEGYNTVGLLVPLTEFERIALEVVSL